MVFTQRPQKTNTMDTYRNVHVKIKRPSEKEKWLKFHNGHYRFKVPCMLYADFENILTLVEEHSREKMNKLKTERKGKTSYTEKDEQTCTIYADVPDPFKMYRSKDCKEKSVEHIEDEIKRLYSTFPQQPMTEITNVLKIEIEAPENCHICLKEFKSWK